MPLPTLSDSEEFVNTLWYGRGGIGKSTDAIHLAMLGRVILIDAESGVKKRPLRRLGIPVDNIHPYKVENYADLDRLYWSVKQMLDEDPDSIAGVVFDSVTEIQKKLIEDIVTTRYNKKTAAGMMDDPFAVERDEWGTMTEQLRRICRRFRDLPCHTAFVCLEKREVDNDGAFYRPALTPAFASDLVGYVDVVVYTDQSTGVTDPTDRSRYIGITQPMGKFRGKDRHGILPPIMANPTADRIIAYINQDGDDMIDTDPFQIAFDERMALRQAAAVQSETTNEQVTADSEVA